MVSFHYKEQISFTMYCLSVCQLYLPGEINKGKLGMILIAGLDFLFGLQFQHHFAFSTQISLQDLSTYMYRYFMK